MATATNCDGLEEYAVLVGASKPFPVTWVSHSWSQLCGFDAGEVRRTPRPNSPAHPKTTRARSPPTRKFPFHSPSPPLTHPATTSPQVLGRDLKCLQGPATSKASIHQLMEGVRAGVPCSVELLNYTKDKRPFQHTVNLAPVRAGDGEVVLFRTTSSKVRKLGAANDANTACGGGVRVDGRCDRERLVAGSMPSCASADSAESGDLRAADDARYDSVESLLEDTVAAQGLPFELADTSLHLDVDAAAVAALVNASPPQLSVPRALAPPDAGFCVVTSAVAPFAVVWASEAWLSLCGFGADDIVGRTLSLIQGPATDLRAVEFLMSCARASVPCDNVRLVNYGKDKRPFVHKLAMAVVRDAHGAPEFLKATSTDVQRLGPLVALQKTLDDLQLQ